MWHNLRFVAESRFVDYDKLIDFVKKDKNQEKYHVIENTYDTSDGKITYYQVNTWHVDDLMRDALEAGAVIRDPSLYGYPKHA